MSLSVARTPQRSPPVELYDTYKIMIPPSQVYRKTGIVVEPPGYPITIGTFKKVTPEMVGASAYQQLDNIVCDFQRAFAQRHIEKQDLDHYTLMHAKVCREAESHHAINGVFEPLWLKYNAFKRSEKNQGQLFTTNALLKRQEQQRLIAEKVAIVAVVVVVLGILGYCLRP